MQARPLLGLVQSGALACRLTPVNQDIGSRTSLPPLTDVLRLNILAKYA